MTEIENNEFKEISNDLLEKFGDVVEAHLKKNLIRLSIVFPEGTLEPEFMDNSQLGPVAQLYMLLHAMKSVLKDLSGNFIDPGKMDLFIDEVIDLIKSDLIDECK